MRLHRITATLFIAVFLVSCSTWTQVGGGPAHTGVAVRGIERADVSRLALAWHKPIGSQFGNHVEPVSDGVTLYLVVPSPSCLDCPGDVGHVAAYDLTTGTRRWTATHVEAVRSLSLAISDGIVVASGLGCTYAYDAATGAPRWKHCLLAPYGSPTVANGFVYEVTQTNVFELRLSDGTWTGRTFENEYWARLATVGNGLLVVGARAWDLATGTQVWYDGGPGESTIVDRTIYKRRWDGDLYAVAIDSNTELWRIPLHCGSPVSPPTVDATTVYLQECGTVRAFDRITGAERWHSVADAFGNDEDRLTLADGLLFLSNWSTELYIVDAADGTLVRDVRLGTPPGSNSSIGPPIVVNGRVVVTGDYGLEVYAPAPPNA